MAQTITISDTGGALLGRTGFAVLRRRWKLPGLTAVAVVIALLALLPLAFVLAVAIETGWTTVVALVVRPRVGELLVNTGLLVLLTVPLCVVLGTALAWLTERTNLPGRRFWVLLCVAPLAIPAFVQSYAWISLVPSLHGLPAGVFLSTLAYFPFLYLPCAAILRRLDPAIEDVAASLGLTPWRIFWRVILPQLRLGIWGGALLVGLHLLAEYGLYVMIRFDTFTTAIFDQFQSTFNGPAANMLAGVLALCCLVLLGGEAATRGRARYARLGAGSAGVVKLHRLGAVWTLPAILLQAAMAALALGVPCATLLRWLSAGGADIWRWGDILPALGQTCFYAAVGALIATCAAMPMAWLSIRAPSRFIRVLEAGNYIGGALPGIVVALALVTITVRAVPALYQTVATILLAYLLLFLPRALIALRASFAQATVELEEISRGLGRTPLRTFWTMTLRLAAPGVAAAIGLVSLGIANELTATLLLAPNGTRTLATKFWALTSEIDYAGAAPYALLMVVLSLPLAGLLYRQASFMSGR